MSVLVDTSVWVAYLRGTDCLEEMDFLIDEGLLAINSLILAELLPSLLLRRKRDLVSLLREVPQQPMSIDWDDLVAMQTTCLRNGINKVGIPDLIIVQHAMRHRQRVFSVDKHFRLLATVLPIDLFEL